MIRKVGRRARRELYWGPMRTHGGGRRWLAALACVAGLATGCDLVFGLSRNEGPSDGKASDGKDVAGLVDAAPLPTCTSAGQEVTLPVLADTYLDAGGAHGAEGVLRVSRDHTLLIAFQTGGLQFTNVRLKLTHPKAARACGPGGTCGQCAADAPGTLHLHWARTDWDELTASRASPDGMREWGQLGASGPTDRSGVLGNVVYNGSGQLVVPGTFYPTDRQVAWPQDALGIELVPDDPASGLAAMFASKDARDDCGAVVPGPELIVTCQ